MIKEEKRRDCTRKAVTSKITFLKNIKFTIIFCIINVSAQSINNVVTFVVYTNKYKTIKQVYPHLYYKDGVFIENKDSLIFKNYQMDDELINSPKLAVIRLKC